VFERCSLLHARSLHEEALLWQREEEAREERDVEQVAER